jgi:hypothetical protein
MLGFRNGGGATRGAEGVPHGRFLDGTLERPFVVDAEERANILRIARLRAGGRADEVGEDDRHDLPLLARLGRRHERGSALRAELRDLGVLVPTRRAGPHRPSLFRQPEPFDP